MDQSVDASVRLPDGRLLGYRESGDRGGAPLFFFHGLPGSRFQCPDDGAAREFGVWLIAPERPGYGSSEPSPDGYALAAWTADVAAFADALAIERFAVAGYSMGGMFALACAHHLPRRVTRLGLISSIAPLDVPENWEGWGGVRAFYELAGNDPAALKLAVEPLAQSPDVFLGAMIDAGADVDKRVLADRTVWNQWLRDTRETFRAGAAAALRDVILCANDWGFDIAGIRAPAFVWHGLDDVHAPPSMARYLGATLPDCRMQLYPGEGHLLMFPRWREILAALAI